MESLSPPRSSTSEPPPPSHGLTAGFDNQMKMLQDSYLGFFLERKRIEDQYIESLQRLHRRTRSIDQYLDERSEPTTTRSVWNEIRENVEREAQTRSAFVASLTVDIIQPLMALKDTQERTRKRIKEDMKDSISSYNDHLDNMLPRLKARYLKKFQEVEEQRKAAAAPPAPPNSPPPGDIHSTPLTNVRSNPTQSPKPAVTAPQPLRPLDRRPSGSIPNRNRSPSSSTTFSDFAQHGKKQLNQLIGFLDKGGAVKETLGNVRGESYSLRAVRAKRELDEADKEYRKGVYWLETLRLHRAKTLEAGYNSLEMFIRDTSVTVKKILETYIDAMTATTTTQTQLSQHCRTLLEKMKSDQDVAKTTSHFARQLQLATPDPVFYQHGSVGICKDLIFGFSLVDYATARGLHDGEIPRIVKLCLREVDQRGLEAEGIYRVSGRLATVQVLQHNIERDEKSFRFSPQQDDVYVVSSLLKLYLRELPEPVFKFPLQDRITHSEEFSEHKANNFTLLRSKIRRLPPVHQAVLKAIIEHLSRVAALSHKNKMDAKNLAIVFRSVIFGEDKLPEGQDLLQVQTWGDTLMEDLIEHAHSLFDETTTDHSHPLPPTPVEAPAPAVYGSQHTKVASIPIDTSGDDFTPQLPPRPADLYSLHPSARTNNPSSPTKDRYPPVPPKRPEVDAFVVPPSPSGSRSLTTGRTSLDSRTDVGDLDDPFGGSSQAISTRASSRPSSSLSFNKA